MRHPSLTNLLQTQTRALSKGPIGLIFCEDMTEIESTITHHQKLGFKALVVFASPLIELPSDIEATVHRVDIDITADHIVERSVNAVNESVPLGTWLFYCYNAEYLFFPFCETRTIGEMLAFHTEERRDAMLTYVVDLYALDLNANPDAVNCEEAHLDKSGYYALAREDPEKGYAVRDRQLDFYGGLRWRFEEHVDYYRRKIDRIGLFKSKPSLKLRSNHTFSDEEYNTYACPWHHNLTATICSFRTAKALRTNPGSRFEIETFQWHNSAKFAWHSQQLLDLGLMEPGQWF